MLVEDICQRDVVTVAREAALGDAARLMRENHVGDVVVVDAERRPLGIITDRDLVIEVLAREIEQDSVRVGDLVAADQLHVTRLDDSVLKAMQIMSDKGVHRLPVVDARGELAGIVSSDEMLSLLSRYLESMSELSRRARSREARMRA